MKRPFASKRPIGPFAQMSNDSLDPEKWLVFDFEGEQWMVESGSIEMHELNIQEKLRQPAGPTGEIIIRFKEKEWKDGKLIKEYEDELPVTTIQIGMLDVIRFDDAVADVTDIVEEYINEQGGSYEDVYTADV